MKSQTKIVTLFNRRGARLRVRRGAAPVSTPVEESQKENNVCDDMDCEVAPVEESQKELVDGAECEAASPPAAPVPDYLARVNFHPRDANIKFFEEGHEYEVCGERGTYTSTTTFIHSMFGHFNGPLMAARIVGCGKWRNDPTYKYYQKSAEEILAMWDENRVEASGAGTKMHFDIECYYNGLEVVNSSVEFGYFRNFLADYPELRPYRTEWCVYDEDVKISGSIDMVFRDEGGGFWIYDWKRSKGIDFESPYGKRGTVAVTADLADCNYIHYSLQLNIYKKILETRYGLRVLGLFLIVLHPNGGNYQRIECLDLAAKVDEIFAWRRAQLCGGGAGAGAVRVVLEDHDVAEDGHAPSPAPSPPRGQWLGGGV